MRKIKFKDKEATFIWSNYGNEDYGKRAFTIIENGAWHYPKYIWRENLDSTLMNYIKEGWKVEVVDSDFWSLEQHREYIEQSTS